MINADQPLSDVDVPTLGVEEEFLVVDPGSGLPVRWPVRSSTWPTGWARTCNSS